MKKKPTMAEVVWALRAAEDALVALKRDKKWDDADSHTLRKVQSVLARAK